MHLHRHVKTDSTFFSALPLIKKRYPNCDILDDTFMVEKTLEITKEVQRFINDLYKTYANMFQYLGNKISELKEKGLLSKVL